MVFFHIPTVFIQNNTTGPKSKFTVNCPTLNLSIVDDHPFQLIKSSPSPTCRKDSVTHRFYSLSNAYSNQIHSPRYTLKFQINPINFNFQVQTHACMEEIVTFVQIFPVYFYFYFLLDTHVYMETSVSFIHLDDV